MDAKVTRFTVYKQTKKSVELLDYHIVIPANVHGCVHNIFVGVITVCPWHIW